MGLLEFKDGSVSAPAASCPAVYSDGGISSAGEGSHAQKFDLDDQRRLARENWLQQREREPATLDLEEVRRRAREEWLRKYTK
jgi:hypothetical protein